MSGQEDNPEIEEVPHIAFNISFSDSVEVKLNPSGMGLISSLRMGTLFLEKVFCDGLNMKRAPCLGRWEGRDTWIYPKRRPRSGSEWLTLALCLDPARGMLFWGSSSASPPLPAWNSLAFLLGQCSGAQNTRLTCTRWACRLRVGVAHRGLGDCGS